jgi:hypothetical protein
VPGLQLDSSPRGIGLRRPRTSSAAAEVLSCCEQCFNCSIFGEFESAKAADSICSLPPCAGGERSERAAPCASTTKCPKSGRLRNSAKTKASSSSFVFGTLSGFVCDDSSGILPFFCLLAGLALGGFFIRLAALHLTKDALALQLLLEDPESLMDIVVANDDLQNVSNLLLALDAPSRC